MSRSTYSDEDMRCATEEAVAVLSRLALSNRNDQAISKNFSATIKQVKAFLTEKYLQEHNLSLNQSGPPRLTQFDFARSDVGPSWVGAVGRLARDAFERLRSESQRKRYGQFFTPPTVSALACSAAITSASASVIDPMCGAGTMLWSAYDRFRMLGASDQGDVLGVELDPLVADIAGLPPDERYARLKRVPRILCADSFVELSGFGCSDGSIKSYGPYDAIVGNPPYIRYQSIKEVLQKTSPSVLKAFGERLPNHSDSAVFDTIIRSCLIANLIHENNTNLRAKASEAIALLRSPASATYLDAVESCWLKLVASYSGLADLSLPAWLLTWRLARPGTIVAYVTTASWKNREYARFLRYFMLRFLQPLMIIEQGGGWFSNAQIPTSLMILRARPFEQAAIPLTDRAKSDHVVRVVHVSHEHNLSDPVVLNNAALTLTEGQQTESGYSIAKSASILIKAIEAQQRDIENNLWNISLIPEQMFVDALLSEDAAASRSNASNLSLQEVDGPARRGRSTVGVSTVDPGRPTVVPDSVCKVLRISSVPSNAFHLFADQNIHVHQGLRTGCNPFFYVRALEASEILECVPGEDPDTVPVSLKNPGQHGDRIREIVAKLSWVTHTIVDEDCLSDNQPCLLVKPGEEFGRLLLVVPSSVLCPVVRYQKDLTRWGIIDPEALPGRAVVTGTGVASDDYSKLSSYPDHWISVWKKRDGLSVLSSGVSKYIALAARTEIERNGRMVAMPELSAVKPNSRQPALPVARLLNTSEDPVPPSPTWWYTMPISSRHTGSVFMARVNDGSPEAYLNSTSKPVLIDANFSTFSLGIGPFNSESLFAFLNSLWVRASLEVIGTPLGGGALKVEAAHLRLLPIPRMDVESIDQLNSLGRELAKLPHTRELPDILRAIDRVVADRVAQLLDLDAVQIMASLSALVSESQKRRRK